MNQGKIQGYLVKNFTHYKKDRKAVFTYLMSLGLDNNRIKQLGDYWRSHCLRVNNVV